MEDTHGVAMFVNQHGACMPSLNPYYNGRYSWSMSGATINIVQEPGLNPYYNGRYSWSLWEAEQKARFVQCLNPYYNGRYSWSQQTHGDYKVYYKS